MKCCAGTGAGAGLETSMRIRGACSIRQLCMMRCGSSVFATSHCTALQRVLFLHKIPCPELHNGGRTFPAFSHRPKTHLAVSQLRQEDRRTGGQEDSGEMQTLDDSAFVSEPMSSPCRLMFFMTLALSLGFRGCYRETSTGVSRDPR